MASAGGKDGPKGFVKRVTSTFSIRKKKNTTTPNDPKSLLPRSKSTGGNYESMRLPQGKKSLLDVKADTKRTKSAGVSPQPRRREKIDESANQFMKMRCFDDNDSIWLSSDCASPTSLLEERRVSVSFHFSVDEKIVSWLSSMAKSSLSLNQESTSSTTKEKAKCSLENIRKDGKFCNSVGKTGSVKASTRLPEKTCEETSSSSNKLPGLEEKKVSFSVESKKAPAPATTIPVTSLEKRAEIGESKRKIVVEPLFWPFEQKFDWTPEDILKHFSMSPRRKKSIGGKTAEKLDPSKVLPPQVSVSAMKSRRLNVSEDHQAILRRHSSISGRENSESLPIDLIIEIVSRLSAKSIARCRCVSKFWASILGRPDFTDCFLTRSSSRPKILFACYKDGELFYFSSPQPQNPDEKSSCLTVNYQRSIKFAYDRVYDICSPVSGLVCHRNDRVLNGKVNPVTELVICNPSTGQSVTLPKMKTRVRKWVMSFAGYDPIEKQFKVLSMALDDGKGIGVSKDHQVLTLGTEKPSWKMIKCGIRHSPRCGGICMDGVLYYKAAPNAMTNGTMLICFHVRSEKFSVVKVMKPFIRAVDSRATLFNYNGKLASLISGDTIHFRATSGSFALFVLEDLEKQEWSKRIYELPPLWQNVSAYEYLYCAGVTGSNEIVLSNYATNPFYVYYYNIERKTTRRLEILGMEAFMKHHVYIFPQYVEDVKLMQSF
ncbi:hypothetical protein AALP_AA6G082400 [Arabis alpina]|uniref:F-box domain-containing protein n=1 Tax=Arabis alpina TaxID=50452 RepID=A0A087GMV9_ARAAL|nr:hypothetical protein AALP_AA6G082400 [Arabis alpina]